MTKHTNHRTLAPLQSLVALALVSFAPVAHAGAPTPLPANVKMTCAFSQADFNAIFESGSVTKDGVVLPADSFSFTPNSLCSFYKWSEQMFLWLTSPAPSRYGPGKHVFDSPVFFSVSPMDANGERTLIPNAPPELALSSLHLAARKDWATSRFR